MVNYHNIVKVRCFLFPIENWQKVVQYEYIEHHFSPNIEIVKLHYLMGNVTIFISAVEDSLSSLNTDSDTLHHNNKYKEHMYLSLHKFELS